MQIQDYLVDQTGLNWESLLDEWGWLLPSSFRVWLLTRAGDLFIVVPDGQVQMLDVGAGTLQQVAPTFEQFCDQLEKPTMADKYLMIPIVDALLKAGVVLGPEQCYSYRELPAFGGTYGAENRMPFPIREHFGGWGAVHRQIADASDGSAVQLEIARSATQGG